MSGALSRRGGAAIGARLLRVSKEGLRTFASLPAEDIPNEPQLPPFDHQPRPYNGPSKQEVLKLRKRYLSPAMFHHFKDPVMVVEGKMQYLWDEQGRRYLDLFGGIVTVSVGHCHDKVNAAVLRQNDLLQHTTTIYLNNEVAEYAKELTDRLPKHLSVAYFVNSGSEANDMAMMLARLYTGNYDMLALRNAYHGLSTETMGVTAHSSWKTNVPHGFGVRHVLNPDGYRGRFGNDGDAYAADVEDMIRFGTPGKVAGFISESVQGVGGAVPLADGYLPKVYDLVRAAGGVCIADEVQSGFGRLGDHYWGFQSLGASPDIVTMAKGIGNGLPLAAVVTTPEIAEVLARKIHFNTYGGNPVSCAAGRAVLRVVDEEGLQENCKLVGGHMISKLRELQEKHDIIGDVRGSGLMIGIELVKDRTTKEAASAETAQVFERLKDLGVLAGKGGFYNNVFRLKPPMCITKDDADFFIEQFDRALSEL